MYCYNADNFNHLNSIQNIIMNESANIIGYRVVFFFDKEIERPDQFFWGLNQISEFDLMPTLQPLPNGIKTNGIPLMSFRSSNGLFFCDITLDRLDFVVRIGDNFGSYSSNSIHEITKSIANRIADFLVELPFLPIIRVGVIGEYFVHTDSAIQKIRAANSMMDSEELFELSVRKNRRVSIAGKLCNKITSMEMLDLPQQNGSVLRGVVAGVDVNNVPEKGNPLTPLILKELLNAGLNCASVQGFKELI